MQNADANMDSPYTRIADKTLPEFSSLLFSDLRQLMLKKVCLQNRILSERGPVEDQGLFVQWEVITKCFTLTGMSWAGMLGSGRRTTQLNINSE